MRNLGVAPFIRSPAVLVAVLTAGPALGQEEDPSFEFGSEEEATELAEQDEVEWDASGQAGFIMTTGNSRTTTFSAGASASRKANQNRFKLDAGAAYAQSSIRLAADTDGSGTLSEDEISRLTQTTTRAWSFNSRYDRFLTTNNSLYALAGVAADRPAGKDLIGNGQLGYSRQLYQDDIHLLVAEVGYDFTYEDLTIGDGAAIHSARGFAGYTGTLSSDTGFEASIEGLFNVNRLETVAGEVDPFEDVRVNGKLSLATHLFGNVSFRLGFETRFDNAPAPLPAFATPFEDGFVPLADRLDTLTEASLIVNFL